MKKAIIRVLSLIVVFFLTIIIASKVMNTGHENLTVEMAESSLPTISMVQGDYVYNTLFGYVRESDISYEQGNTTFLDENRQTGYLIRTYGRKVKGLQVCVRGTLDRRLIEDSPVDGYEARGDELVGTLQLKDLLTPGEVYSLELILELEQEEKVYYYTRVLFDADAHVEEELGFVYDFHDRLFDRDRAKNLTTYLETDPTREDNSTFYRVNIYSSFRQLTYGDLAPTQVGDTYVTLVDNAGTLSTLRTECLVSTGVDPDRTYYLVRESFRLRYAEERFYLLDYNRSMEQIPHAETMCTNDKLALGIANADVSMMESSDGGSVAFMSGDELFCYNATLGRLGKVFRFHDDTYSDPRTLFSPYRIRILDVNEAGNVKFAVYGYMCRGRHEGEVGIEIYDYDGAQNTIEELCYISYAKTASILIEEMDRLLFLNRENILYLTLEDNVYRIGLEDQTVETLSELVQGDTASTSADHRLLVDTEGDARVPVALTVSNLNTESGVRIESYPGEAIYFLGFVGEDLIYGRARLDQACQESSGAAFYPMYALCICDELGETIKEYLPEDGIYIKDVSTSDSQIVMERIRLTEDGYEMVMEDHITTGLVENPTKNTVAVANIDIYENYVQIQTRNDIDTASLLVMTPSEVVYEGGRELELEVEDAQVRYYLYGSTGVAGIYTSPAVAVSRAVDTGGQIYDADGTLIWRKSSRAIRNQIMAIGEETVTEDKDSLAVCLDTILKYNDVIRNSDYLLGQGKTVFGILEDNLPEVKVLNLTGCTMDSMLYYLNLDIPVLVLLRDGNALLLTGFNESQVVVLDPAEGTLSKVSQSEAAALFAENGNSFITYIK
ncbi:MAG: hypothetical protein K5891_05880 [Lachnospiraceae bacterium]|nr:hypothetical protein [Lachnospiraceae bacterium]